MLKRQGGFMSADFDYEDFYEACHESGMTDEDIQNELEHLDYRATEYLENFLEEKDSESFGNLINRSNKMLEALMVDLEIYNKMLAKMANEIKEIRGVV
jgi:mevalonate kinase